jgi:hypothetical protein
MKKILLILLIGSAFYGGYCYGEKVKEKECMSWSWYIYKDGHYVTGWKWIENEKQTGNH